MQPFAFAAPRPLSAHTWTVNLGEAMDRFLQASSAPLPVNIAQVMSNHVYAGTYEAEVASARTWCSQWCTEEANMVPSGHSAAIRTATEVKSATMNAPPRAPPLLFGGCLGMLDLVFRADNTCDVCRTRWMVEQINVYL